MTGGGYLPLWRSILQSSIMEESLPTRFIWITMLIAADREGRLKSTPYGISRLANVSLDETRAAMKVLMAPDPQSGSTEEEGRRIVEETPNVWRLVNYEHYQDEARVETRRAKEAERSRRYRERQARHDPSRPVTNGNGSDVTERDRHDSVTIPASGSGSGSLLGKKKGSEEGKKRRFKKPTAEEVQLYLIEKGETRFGGEEFIDAQITRGWLVGKNKTPMKDWKGAVRTWIHNRNKDGQPQLADRIAETIRLTDFEDWLSDTVRRADRDTHGNHSMWDEYADAACEFPPRQAPKFEEWLRGQMEE